MNIAFERRCLDKALRASHPPRTTRNYNPPTPRAAQPPSHPPPTTHNPSFTHTGTITAQPHTPHRISRKTNLLDTCLILDLKCHLSSKYQASIKQMSFLLGSLGGEWVSGGGCWVGGGSVMHSGWVVRCLPTAIPRYDTTRLRQALHFSGIA